MRKLYVLLIALGSFAPAAFAQPTNDICANAIVLEDLSNFCSVSGSFTNEGANDENYPEAACFLNTTIGFDVWFSFTAVANGLSLAVIGDNDPNLPGGTLPNPDVALYAGPCTSLLELACNNDAMEDGFVQLLSNELVIGQTYYIRVSAANQNTGTFSICINNFNLVPDPSSDCGNAVILCDKSPFTVPQVVGAGTNPNELTGVVCGGFSIDEDASTWYKWTCDVAGTLSFVLTPLNPADDLDFYIYELPGGLSSCNGKILRREMSSGQQGNQPFSVWQPCTGQTGLSLSSTDVGEQCGCQSGNDNFLAALNMVAGRSYALVINNFSESGAGFTIEFGGTGTFLGPNAAFTAVPQQICVGESVTFQDASTFVDPIVARRWSFGAGATPATASGTGPFVVTYNRPGVKSIILELESNRGCIVTEINTVEVVCCEDHFTTSAVVTDIDCPNASTGSIDFSVTNNFGPYIYNWSNGAITQDILGLTPGMYTLALSDQSGCRDTLDFAIDAPPPFNIDSLVVMPTCNGGTDGAVTVLVTGATPPYQYNWQNTGFSTNNTLSNISQGDYSVTIRDANGCLIQQVMPVRELQLTLNPQVQAITQPSCFGFDDGRIVLDINNGLPAYQFDFNDGNGFQPGNILNNLSAGTYQVDVLDANLCRGDFTFVIEDHPPLTLAFNTTNISCFGLTDGSIQSLVGGGVGGYTYLWSNGQQLANISDLPAGNYLLTVTDANGCIISGDTLLTQPPQLFLRLLEVVDNICFGESEGSIRLEASGGTPGYEYSADGFNFQLDSLLTGLPAGDYLATVMDALGCTATVEASISQPIELLVDAGPDRFILLGYDTLITAISNYPSVTFSWTPMDSLICLTPGCDRVQVDPVNTTTYQVSVINEAGCIAIDLVTIRVIKDRPLFVPNVFSPNDDGVNDGFTLFGGPGLRRIQKLQVFSRWGSLVYEARDILPNDPALGWDGTFRGQAVNPDVFVYIAQVEFIDGVVETVKGDVTVIR